MNNLIIAALLESLDDFQCCLHGWRLDSRVRGSSGGKKVLTKKWPKNRQLVLKQERIDLPGDHSSQLMPLDTTQCADVFIILNLTS